MAMAVLGTGFTLSFSSSPLSPSHHRFLQPKFHCQNPSFRVSCSMKDTETDSRAEYKPGMLDDLFLNLFRNKMVQEVGWDSEKPGYNGLIEVANHLMTGRSNSETKEAAVRILKSLFPPFLLELYRILITPIGGGKVSAMMVARVTALSCQWLMGPCTVNSVDLPDGSSCKTGVFVERCKYLEESKCVGICINTCKLPTQTFFKDYMGVPLLMEPNFSDYSCQMVHFRSAESALLNASVGRNDDSQNLNFLFSCWPAATYWALSPVQKICADSKETMFLDDHHP